MTAITAIAFGAIFSYIASLNAESYRPEKKDEKE